MATPVITIKVTGVPAAVSYLKRVEKKLSDNRPGFKKVRVRYSQMVSDVFKSEGGPWQTNKWPALSPMRVAIRGGKANPILRWTNVLMKVAMATSPTVMTDTARTIVKTKSPVPGKNVKVDRESPTSMAYLLQETADYMAAGLAGPKTIHQYGGKVPGLRAKVYTLPKREFWPWSMQTYNQLVHTWALYLDDIIK